METNLAAGAWCTLCTAWLAPDWPSEIVLWEEQQATSASLLSAEQRWTPAWTGTDLTLTGELLEDGTIFPLGLPRITEHLPWGRKRDRVVFTSIQFLTLPTSHSCGLTVQHSASVPIYSVPAAPALNKDNHSARTTQWFSATDEHLPLLPALQPREIKCRLSLFPSTDPRFISSRSLTNTACAPHLFSAYHLLVS